jgi:hypothetical protein
MDLARWSDGSLGVTRNILLATAKPRESTFLQYGTQASTVTRRIGIAKQAGINAYFVSYEHSQAPRSVLWVKRGSEDALMWHAGCPP